MTEALATKEILKQRRSMYRAVADSATISGDKYLKTEIKLVSVISPKRMQEKGDKLSQALRVLDTKIQEQNWLASLKDFNGVDYVSSETSDIVEKLLILY